MPIQKIKSGRVLSPEVTEYIGNKGQIFFDEDTGELRLSDGITPGGIPLTSNSGLADVLISDPQSGQTLQYNGVNWINVNPGSVGLSTATNTQLGGVKIGSNINISAGGTISVTTGAGINRVVDIPDVNSNGLTDGSILIYNAAMNRWDLTDSFESDSTASADGGEF
jgi:hypothetical protein